MEILKQLFERAIGTKPDVFKIGNLDGGTTHVIVAPPGWQQLRAHEVGVNKFPRVWCESVASLHEYVKRFQSDEHAYFANEEGIRVDLDYAGGLRPLDRAHRVFMPADWSPEFRPAIAAILAGCGKPLKLEAFEILMQTAALAVRNSTQVLEVIGDLEGVEIVKARRSQTGHMVQLGGDVKAREGVSIPRSLDVAALYMGRVVTASVPFRVTVEGGAISFTLVNDSAIEAAKSKAREAVFEEFEKLIQPAVLIRGGRKE